jgi:hypothetical protein
MIDLRPIHIELPPWVDQLLADWPKVYGSDEAGRARINIQPNTTLAR